MADIKLETAVYSPQNILLLTTHMSVACPSDNCMPHSMQRIGHIINTKNKEKNFYVKTGVDYVVIVSPCTISNCLHRQTQKQKTDII